MRNTLFRTYWAMRDVIAPKLKYSQSLYEDALASRVDENTRWLDLGCGHQVLPAWRLNQEKEIVSRCRMVVGMDYDHPSLVNHMTIPGRVRGDISKLPFADGAFDLVTANMVVEHLDDPAVQFREIRRVLRPGGAFMFHTPNAKGYSTLLARMAPESWKAGLIYVLDKRKEEDVFPAHYRANTLKSIDELAHSCGFRIASTRMLVSDAVFAVVPPLAFFELIVIRALMTDALKRLRPNIIAVLEKRAEPSSV